MTNESDKVFEKGEIALVQKETLCDKNGQKNVSEKSWLTHKLPSVKAKSNEQLNGLSLTIPVDIRHVDSYDSCKLINVDFSIRFISTRALGVNIFSVPILLIGSKSNAWLDDAVARKGNKSGDEGQSAEDFFKQNSNSVNRSTANQLPPPSYDKLFN
mgnify:CR=1 FL=1